MSSIVGGAEPHHNALRAARGDVAGTVRIAEQRERAADHVVLELAETLEEEPLPEAVGGEVQTVRVGEELRVLVVHTVHEAEEPSLAVPHIVRAGGGEQPQDLVGGLAADGEGHAPVRGSAG
jgi:hypothetical protein